MCLGEVCTSVRAIYRAMRSSSAFGLTGTPEVGRFAREDYLSAVQAWVWASCRVVSGGAQVLGWRKRPTRRRGADAMTQSIARRCRGP
jgi:hypothetical protein